MKINTAHQDKVDGPLSDEKAEVEERVAELNKNEQAKRKDEIDKLIGKLTKA